MPEVGLTGGILHRMEKVLEVYRLGQKALGPEFHCLRCGFDVPIGRENDDHGLGVANLAKEIEPVDVRHRHVDDRHVGPSVTPVLDPVSHGRRGRNGMPVAGEVRRHGLENRLVIIDEQYPQRAFRKRFGQNSSACSREISSP